MASFIYKIIKDGIYSMSKPGEAHRTAAEA